MKKILFIMIAAIAMLTTTTPADASIVYGPPVYIKHNSVDEGYYNSILVAQGPDHDVLKALARGQSANAYSVKVRAGEELWCDFGNGNKKVLDATGWHDAYLGSAPWRGSLKCDIRKD